MIQKAAAVLALSAALGAVSAGAEGGLPKAASGAARAVREAKAPLASAVRGPGASPVLRDETTSVLVELNDKTVKCSRADYSEPMLKVLIPALAELTVLNHRNTREGAPCVSAGPCGAMGPQDILKEGSGAERVPIRVVLRKTVELDGEVCRVSLIETVTTVIRGVPFVHERGHALAERDPADCR